MSYTLTTSKLNPDRVRHIGVPAVCCVMGCHAAPAMSRKLKQIRAWASLCEKHFGPDNLKLDMSKMFSVKKANNL